MWRWILQKITSIEDMIRFNVYLFENAVLNFPPGQEQMAWLVDFTGWSLAKSMPFRLSREFISILQNHYPNRLAIAILYNPPRAFEAFFKVRFQCLHFIYKLRRYGYNIVFHIFILCR